MTEELNSTRTFETSVDFEGKDYAVQYSVISGSVVVNSVVGEGAHFIPHLSTHIDTWSFLSFVLPALLPEAEGELKFGLFCLGALLDAGLVGKEEIVQPVGNGIVEEGGHPEEPF